MNEFTSFQKQRSKFIEPFMKKVEPNFNKPPGAKRYVMIPEPQVAPQPKKVNSMRESAASQQHVPKSFILPPAKSPIIPLLTPESTISIFSPLPATPKLSSSITKGLRQKGRKYISSSSSNLDEEDTTKTKPCAGMDVVPYEVKEVPNSLYKPSATVLSALLQDLLKQ